MDKHYNERNEFFAKIPRFWDRMYGIEYALFDCYKLSQSQAQELRNATGEAYFIYKKMNHLIRNAPDETLLSLGFPAKAIPFLRDAQLPYETVIGRFDFVMTNEGLKIIEFNSDTPTFIRELFEINGLVCKQFHFHNPNEYEEECLGKSIRNSVFHCAKSIGVHAHPYVVFTAHEDDIEDRETMKYLMDVAKIKDAIFVSLRELQVVSEGEYQGVYDPSGKKIDIVYRHTIDVCSILYNLNWDMNLTR